jgi:hypothetical protein
VPSKSWCNRARVAWIMRNEKSIAIIHNTHYHNKLSYDQIQSVTIRVHEELWKEENAELLYCIIIIIISIKRS